MNIESKILSFRYRKNFIFNYLKRKRLSAGVKQISVQSHSFCPICKSEKVELIAQVDRTGSPCDTVVCGYCGFMFNNTFMGDPASFYSCDWGQERWGNPEVNFLRRTASDAYSWKRMAYVLKKLGSRFKKVETVLEVGCGDGCNLLPYHLIGKDVVGCDFDARFLAPGRHRGMNLIQGDINNVSANHKFDLIMLIHSFEHVIDLDKTVRDVARRLSDGGVVFVEVPGVMNWNRTKNSTKSAMGLKSSNNIMGYLQFQHNYYFDLGHLIHIWERNGFDIIVGDEWVRAIFKKKDDTDNVEAGVISGDVRMLRKNVIGHLKEIERDFLRISNLFCELTKAIFRKFYHVNKS